MSDPRQPGTPLPAEEAMAEFVAALELYARAARKAELEGLLTRLEQSHPLSAGYVRTSWIHDRLAALAQEEQG